MILNTGQGKRPTRMYHMDIAPTVLARMGVRSNVRVMAGQDRGGPDAPDSTVNAAFMFDNIVARQRGHHAIRVNRNERILIPITLDTRKAKTMRLTVDKGNDTRACDWFSVAFPQLQTVANPSAPDAASD